MRTSFENVKNRVEILDREVSSLNGQCILLQQDISDIKLTLDKLEKQREVTRKAVEVIDLASQAVRESIREGFESIVTYALQHVLRGGGYKFELLFGRRGNLQEVDLQISTETLAEGYDPLETSGGGVIDIVSLALRVALIELYKPKIEGPLVLDESFKHLSRQHLYSAGEFLKALTTRIDRQIIMVTHKSELVEMADKGITVDG